MPPPPPSAGAIGLADLVSSLVSLREPSRELDDVIETMLGGPRILARATVDQVRAGLWLSGETPCYTAGGSALSVLARRRGYRAEARREGSVFVGEARCMSTGRTARATAFTEGAAGTVAVALLASREHADG